MNGFVVLETHYTVMPDRRDPAWRRRASMKYGGLNSWRWKKEYEIDWTARAGLLVFELWSSERNRIKPFAIPDHWPKWLLVDPGWTNPTAMLWVAVDVDTTPNILGFQPIHVYREFYRSRHSAETCANIAFEWSQKPDDGSGHREMEWIESIIIDPAAKQEHQSAAAPDNVNESAATVLEKFEGRIRERGWDVPVDAGNNAKDTAIEELIFRVGGMWVDRDGIPLYDENDKFREPTDDDLIAGAEIMKPTLFVHEGCIHTAREMEGYRWRDWASGEVADRRNQPEKPVDKDDHSVTCLIRFSNFLRDERGEGTELADYIPRERPKRWKSPDEVIEEEYRTRAARHRKRMRRER